MANVEFKEYSSLCVPNCLRDYLIELGRNCSVYQLNDLLVQNANKHNVHVPKNFLL